ncbi:MAG: hypothetical protein GTO14_04855, partial [Anaerolineales bacterium]|nr:hypothetical protein [Anaerolineae bacterium]NIS79535.1 hypothetical protein [Anaerolineales bacterium]
RELMLDYLADHYQPANTVVAAAGNIQHTEIVSMVNQALGKWPGRPSTGGYLTYKESAFPRLCIENKK